MNDQQQDRYVKALALSTAAKSEAGQLYHKHAIQLIDELVDKLLHLGRDVQDHEIVAIVRQMQGVMLCLEWEGDTVHKGLQQGRRLAEKAHVPLA